METNPQFLMDKLAPVKGVLSIAACLLLALGSAREARAYQNPVLTTITDPDVSYMPWQQKYYCIRPAGSAYLLYNSTDLVNWNTEKYIYQAPSGAVCWGGYQIQDTAGNVWMYTSLNWGGDNCSIGVAQGTSPNADSWYIWDFSITNAIDPVLFRDDDGSLYLYYKHEVTGLNLWVQKMSNYHTPSGSPIHLLDPNTTGWEACGEPQLEGCGFIKYGGVYYLLYTGGYYDSTSCYGIGAAWSTSPTGPFTKCSNNPFISKNQNSNVLTAGSPNTVLDASGNPWITYRTWPTAPNGNRVLSIDPLTVDNVNHKLTCPTTWGTAQPNPSVLRMDIFYQNTNVHAAEVAWTINGGWTGEADREGAPAGNGYPGSALAASTRGDGMLDVCMRGNDNTLKYTCYHDGGWSAGWSTVVGPTNLASAPGIASYYNNRIDIFYQTTNHQIAERAWTSTGGWTGEVPKGGNPYPGSAPAVVTRADGYLEVFIRGATNDLQHIWYAHDAGGWNTGGWQSLGGTMTSDPCAASYGSSRTDVFYLGANNEVMQRGWNGSTWSGEISHGGSACPGSAPGVVSYADGCLYVWVRTTANSLQGIYFMNGAWNTSGWGTAPTPHDLNSAPSAVSWNRRN